MDEIRVPAHELENTLFGPGYTLTGVTFDGDAQTIILHAGRGGSVYNAPPILAASALNGRGAPRWGEAGRCSLRASNTHTHPGLISADRQRLLTRAMVIHPDN
jgi:hypothetical protein